MHKKLNIISLSMIGLGIIVLLIGLLLGGLDSYQFLPF